MKIDWLIDCVIFIGQFPEGIPSNQVHGFQTCPHQTDEPYPPPPPRIFHTMLLTNPKKATNMTKVWQRRTASGIWRPAWDLKRSVLFARSRLPSPSMSISSKARSFASPAVESFNSLEPCTNSTISSSVSSQARRISAMSPALSPASSWPRFRRKLGSILGNGASVGLGQRLGVTSCTSLFHEGVIFEVKMIIWHVSSCSRNMRLKFRITNTWWFASQGDFRRLTTTKRHREGKWVRYTDIGPCHFKDVWARTHFLVSSEVRLCPKALPVRLFIISSCWSLSTPVRGLALRARSCGKSSIFTILSTKI